MSGWDYVGVDWSSGSWVAVGYDRDERPSVSVFNGFRELWEDIGEDAERVVVDVPIGLNERADTEDGTELSRRCDGLARTAIGDRRSSVFTPPCREVAALAFEGADYSEVNETNMDVTGKGLTKQAANISDGIHEVDTFLRSHEDARDIVVEGHPEVCFRAFNGAPPSSASGLSRASRSGSRLSTEWGNSMNGNGATWLLISGSSVEGSVSTTCWMRSPSH